MKKDKMNDRKAAGYIFTEIPSDRGGMLLKIAYEVYLGEADGVLNAIEVSIGDGDVQVFELSRIEKDGFMQMVSEFAKQEGLSKK